MPFKKKNVNELTTKLDIMHWRLKFWNFIQNYANANYVRETYPLAYSNFLNKKKKDTIN